MIIQCDFDGTIATANISLLLREEFITGDWRKIEADYLSGKLTVEVSNQRQFALLMEPRDKLVAFARKHARVRDGFLEFVQYCQNNDIEFVIVSSGLDFYIQAVLEQINAPDLELHCAHTDFGQDSIAVTYTGPDGNMVKNGFKRRYLDWLKQRSDAIAYLGDGLSDLEPASAADYVFATGSLPALLKANSISHYTFASFYDILQQIRRIQEKRCLP